MPYADSEGASIYYEVHGAGPAVVLIHGSGGHHTAWWQQVPDLARSYTVITVDLFGFGNSSAERDEFDAQLFPGDVLAALDAAGVPSAVLVGQSLGAAVALKLAVSHPERVTGVILAQSVGGIDNADLAEAVRTARAAAQEMPLLDRLLSRNFQEQEPAKTFLFQQMGTFNSAKMANLKNHQNGPTVEQIRESGVQVCFLAGERDAMLHPETVATAHQLLPGSLVQIVREGPHSMYWETPDLFNAALASFLRQIYAPSPVS